MKCRAALAFVGLIVFCARGTLTYAEPPKITALMPSAVRPGESTELTIIGQGLADPQALWTSIALERELLAPAEKAESMPEGVRYRVGVPSEQTVGIYGLRLVTAQGVSSLRLFMIDDLETVEENGQNASPQAAQQLQPHQAVEGAVQPQAMDYYKFNAAKGKRVSIEVVARRLGSPLDPVVRLFDHQGHELAYSDDEEGTQGDCRLLFTAPADGIYTIELRDIRYHGGPEHRYRLRIGDFPLITACFPLAVQQHSHAQVTFTGPAGQELDRLITQVPATAAGQRLPIAARFPGGRGSAMASLAVSDLIECVEFEPNEGGEQTMQLAVPAAINGRFDADNDRDSYHFEAKKGQSLRFEGITRRLGSPADLYLRIYDQAGKQLAEVDDSGRADAALDFTAPEDGTYRLAVEELTRRGGPEYVYRIEARPSQPSFALSVNADRFNPPQAGVFVAEVKSARHNYNGPITLSLAGAPAGCLLADNVIAEGKNETTLRVTMPDDVGPGHFAVVQIVGIGKAGEREIRAAASADDALREEFQGLEFLPAELTASLGLGIGPKFPEFFKISAPAEGVLLPQFAGVAQFELKAERTHGFDGPIAVMVEDLPAGFSGESKAIEKGQASATLSIRGPQTPALAEHRFRVKATATHQNQPGQVVVTDLPLKIVPAISISIAPQGPVAAGGKQKVKIAVQRHGVAKGPLTIGWEGLPGGVTAPEATVPEEATEIEVELSAADDAARGKFDQLRAVARAEVQGRRIVVVSDPTAIEISSP